MEAKELRIGNLVRDQFGEEFIISGLFPENAFGYEIGDIDYEVLLPVPLTEQRLIKFGFKYDENRGYNSEEVERKIYSYKGFDLTIEKNGEIRIWNECDDKWYSHYGKELKFVHKLQNYFYEVKDEELIIKLNN